jgi:hypothetical protein
VARLAVFIFRQQRAWRRPRHSTAHQHPRLIGLHWAGVGCCSRGDGRRVASSTTVGDCMPSSPRARPCPDLSPLVQPPACIAVQSFGVPVTVAALRFWGPGAKLKTRDLSIATIVNIIISIYKLLSSHN